jgi:8-oxo-dGTP pyrophosphatase MutT (NUDIX family)
VRRDRCRLAVTRVCDCTGPWVARHAGRHDRGYTRGVPQPSFSSAVPAAVAARRLLDPYLAHYPGEGTRLRPLLELLDASGDVDSRMHLPGHLTAGALIVDPSPGSATPVPGPAILLVHHNKLAKWLQPGGHLDPGERPVDAARREAAEEVGLTDLTLHPWHAEHGGMPIDIDVHPIPDNPKKGEPAHFHHDFRYVFLANDPGGMVKLATAEVAQFRWAPLAGPDLPADLVVAISKVRRLYDIGTAER